MLKTNEVRIETCTLCNYKCTFCPHSTKFTRKKEIMSLETFRGLVDKIKSELPEITEITISGFGESFLDQTIMDKIKYAKEAKYNVHILSNGSLFSKDIIDELHNISVEEIRISLHSINPDTYNKLTRSSGYFNNVIKNINYIISKNINLVLTFEIINGINDIEIPDIIQKFDKVATIEMWKPHNWVKAFKYRKGESVKRTCGRPWNSPYQIQVDGTVNMCCFDYNGELLLGDFTKQTMKEIFKDVPYTSLYNAHMASVLDKSSYICKDCDQRKDQKGIVIYNNKFTAQERIYKVSTTYKSI